VKFSPAQAQRGAPVICAAEIAKEERYYYVKTSFRELTGSLSYAVRDGFGASLGIFC
jgi:hypothetical protein